MTLAELLYAIVGPLVTEDGEPPEGKDELTEEQTEENMEE